MKRRWLWIIILVLFPVLFIAWAVGVELGYLIDLLLHIFVVLVFILSYISLERAYAARSHPNASESKDVKDFVLPSLEIKQLQKDVDKANNIGVGALLIFQELRDHQQVLQAEVDKVLPNIVNLQESVKSIDDTTRQSANTLVDADKVLANLVNLQETLKSIEDATRRFENILLGPQSKGALGEKIIEQQLAQLPQEWIQRDVPYPNLKKVEFALRVPDARIIPIDSKWTGTELMDKLGQTTDATTQENLKKSIVSEVWRRAREVLKYLDKDRTLGFCIVAVPDPVFHISWGIQARLLAANIVLISYSLLIPYILIIVKLFWSSAQSIQALQISHVLNRSLAQIQQLQQLIDTDVSAPLNALKQEEVEHSQSNVQFKEALDKLHQIHGELSAIQSTSESLSKPAIDPLTEAKISAVPGTLKYHLSQLGDSLRDGIQKGQQDNDQVDQQSLS